MPGLWLFVVEPRLFLFVAAIKMQAYLLLHFVLVDYTYFALAKDGRR